MNSTTWRLDAATLPQMLVLEISEDIHNKLEQLSAQTGRSMRDLAEELVYFAAAKHRIGSPQRSPHPIVPGHDGARQVES